MDLQQIFVIFKRYSSRLARLDIFFKISFFVTENGVIILHYIFFKISFFVTENGVIILHYIFVAKVTLNARDRKIDVYVIHKIGFFQDLTDRVYKHRSDKPTTYVDPTANIPSNQMIMDELFSLQVYISNRKHALDAQYEQVQIELQRFSYNINMMDLDEESFGPESHINSKSRGGGEHAQVILKSNNTSQSMLLSEKYTVKTILGEIVKEDLAPNLGMVLMKTPTSQKEEKEEYL
ncbi:hypothetical protein Lal_00032285 [Lupinus albus]|nr:hypothetical protein Lal_00032285 [Lupinus albus]